MVVSVLVVNGLAAGVVDGWFLAAPAGLSFDDQFVGGGDPLFTRQYTQPGGLGECTGVGDGQRGQQEIQRVRSA